MKLLLTHGAGGNRNSPLLAALARRLETSGIEVIRYSLAFRQNRPHGPPRPSDAAHDRAGLRDELLKLRSRGAGRVFAGGQSYGGRQASMLVAEDASLIDGLLLLSYPLHPPGKPEQLRTAHFPSLRTPSLFVQGTRDPFATIDQIAAAIRAIPARTELVPVERAGHDLKGAAEAAASAFERFFGLTSEPR